MRNLVNIRKVKSKLLVMFVLMSILSFPFKYHLIKINFLTIFFKGITKRIAPLVLDNVETYTLELYSDSTGMYLNLISVFIVSLVITIIWNFFEKKIGNIIDFDDLYTLFVIGVCYYLSMQMSIYGFSKLFKYQFYDANPNTLFTPVGFLTKDFLYWTSIGSSKLYNTIVGLVEISIAVLLLFKRTRLLGGVLGGIVCFNIVLINFAFDINVKLQSVFFLLLFLMVSYPALKNLYVFFIKQKSVRIHSRLMPFFKKHHRNFILIKSVVIILIFIESLYPYVKTNNFNGDALIKPPYYGAYKINNNDKYKRFFIHSDPYFIIQSHNDKLLSFKMKLSQSSLKLSYNEFESVLSFKTNDSIMLLKGDFFGDSLNIDATKINIENMPLYKDNFKWTIDQY